MQELQPSASVDLVVSQATFQWVEFSEQQVSNRIE
jgi:hypothetical protein